MGRGVVVEGLVWSRVQRLGSAELSGVGRAEVVEGIEITSEITRSIILTSGMKIS